MQAELIAIGDELLIGQVINTNAARMASQLNEVGVDVRQITCVSDTEEEIERALHEAENRCNLILITGGLGPTKDDITKKVICKYFNTDLIQNNEVLTDVKILFEKRGLPLTELNQEQALVPRTAVAIRNPLGTAPGLAVEKDKKHFVFMPGVPYEMQYMMDKYVVPFVKEHYKSRIILHKTILTHGMGESFLADKIAGWEDSLPNHIKLAYLPAPGMVRLRLSARGSDSKALETELNTLTDKLKGIIPEYIFGYDDETLESIIGKLLKEKGATLSTAESCTGGYIAHLITSIAGSSQWFKGSVIAYHNDIKQSTLDVSPDTLKKHGAVSSHTVIAMAEGIKSRFQTDYSIAVSGIAGPDGGTKDKPVGTVWIAVVGPNEECMIKKYRFGDQRDRNIIRAAQTALDMLRKVLNKQY